MRIPERLKSRKFWAWFGAFISALAAGEIDLAIQVTMVYLGVQTAQDTFQPKNVNVVTSDQSLDGSDEVDTSTLVGGDELNK